MRAHADHLDRLAGRVLADQRHHFRGADIESDDQRFVAFAVHVCGFASDSLSFSPSPSPGAAVTGCQLRAKPVL